MRYTKTTLKLMGIKDSLSETKADAGLRIAGVESELRAIQRKLDAALSVAEKVYHDSQLDSLNQAQGLLDKAQGLLNHWWTKQS